MERRWGSEYLDAIRLNGNEATWHVSVWMIYGGSRAVELEHEAYVCSVVILSEDVID